MVELREVGPLEVLGPPRREMVFVLLEEFIYTFLGGEDRKQFSTDKVSYRESRTSQV